MEPQTNDTNAKTPQPTYTADHYVHPTVCLRYSVENAVLNRSGIQPGTASRWGEFLSQGQKKYTQCEKFGALREDGNREGATNRYIFQHTLQ